MLFLIFLLMQQYWCTCLSSCSLHVFFYQWYFACHTCQRLLAFILCAFVVFSCSCLLLRSYQSWLHLLGIYFQIVVIAAKVFTCKMVVWASGPEFKLDYTLFDKINVGLLSHKYSDVNVKKLAKNSVSQVPYLEFHILHMSQGPDNVVRHQVAAPFEEAPQTKKISHCCLTFSCLLGHFLWRPLFGRNMLNIPNNNNNNNNLTCKAPVCAKKTSVALEILLLYACVTGCAISDNKRVCCKAQSIQHFWFVYLELSYVLGCIKPPMIFWSSEFWFGPTTAVFYFMKKNFLANFQG